MLPFDAFPLLLQEMDIALAPLVDDYSTGPRVTSAA